MRRLLVALLFISAPACFLGASLDDFAGGQPSVHREDAADAAPTIDAPSTIDGPTSVDAGRFCERQTPAPTFCADFDRGLPVSYDWSQVKSETDVIALDPLAFEGPSSAFFQRGEEGCTPVQLKRTFASVGSSIHVELMMRPSHVDGGVTTGYFGSILLRDSTGDGCAVIFDRPSAEKLGFKEDANDPTVTGSYINATRFPVVNQWTKVAIHFTRAESGSALLNVDVADGPAITDHPLLSCRFGEAVLSIGPGCGVAGAEMRFDNVAIRAE